METDEKTKVKRPNLCVIDIMFPVESDEQALKVKRDISEVLKDLEQKRIKFTMTEG